MKKFPLLDSEQLPTMQELQDHFRENDFTTAQVMPLDTDHCDSDTVEQLAYLRSMMRGPWEDYSRALGMRPSDQFSNDNPLIALQNSTEDLVSTAVLKLIEDHPETVAAVLSQFDFSDPGIVEQADRMLDAAVRTTMQVMDYEKLLEVIKEAPAHEDFNPARQYSPSAIDFYRKWNHTRSKVSVVPLEATDENGDHIQAELIDTGTEVETAALLNQRLRDFWRSLDQDSQHLLQLKMDGLTTQEIAEELGLKTHSSVVKRLKKLREQFESM